MLREIEERTDNLHCPLSGELMSDPVTDADGNTFERGNILVWLEDRGCSPITNRVMTKDELRSNAVLKETIIKKHELMRKEIALADANQGWQYATDRESSNVVEGNTDTTPSKDKSKSSLMSWFKGASNINKSSSTTPKTVSHSFAEAEKEATRARKAQEELEKKRSKKKKEKQKLGVHFAMDDKLSTNTNIEQLRGENPLMNSVWSDTAISPPKDAGADDLAIPSYHQQGSNQLENSSAAPAPAPAPAPVKENIIDVSASLKKKKKKVSTISSAPIDISDNSSFASGVSTISREIERGYNNNKKKKKKKNEIREYSTTFRGVFDPPRSGYGATSDSALSPTHLDDRAGPKYHDMRPRQQHRSFSPSDFIEDADISQRDVCSNLVVWSMTTLCCPLPPSSQRKDPSAQHKNPWIYWNLHISLSGIIDSTILSPFWRWVLCCKSTDDSDRSSTATAEVPSEGNFGIRKTPQNYREDGNTNALTSLIESTISVMMGDGREADMNMGCNDEEHVEQELDLMIEGLRGLSLAWLHLLTLISLLCWSSQGFSAWLGDALTNSGSAARTILKLLIPNPGMSEAVSSQISTYTDIMKEKDNNGDSKVLNEYFRGDTSPEETLNTQNVTSFRAMLSFLSLADALPITVLLFTIGYSILRSYKYTILARAEMQREAKRKTAIAFTTAYLDERARELRDREEARVTGIDSDEEGGSVASIQFKGETITLPQDVVETADLRGLGATISIPPSHAVSQQRRGSGPQAKAAGMAPKGSPSTSHPSLTSVAPLPLPYRLIDFFTMGFAFTAPCMYAVLLLTLLCVAKAGHSSTLGVFSTLYWRNCSTTWWTAVIPLPLNNLVPLLTASSSSILEGLETTYTNAVNSLLSTSSMTTNKGISWTLGYDLSSLFIDVSLKTALTSPYLLLGLCMQVGLLTVVSVIGLSYSEQLYSAVFSLTTGTHSLSGKQEPPTAINYSRLHSSTSAVPDQGVVSPRVVGLLSIWRPLIGIIIGLIVLIRTTVIVRLIGPIVGSAESLFQVETSSAWPGSGLSPLSTNAMFVARAVYTPWCRLDASMFGILFYLITVPGGLSLKPRRKRNNAITSSGDNAESKESREYDYRAVVLLSHGSVEGPQNCERATASCIAEPSTRSDSEEEEFIGGPNRIMGGRKSGGKQRLSEDTSMHSFHNLLGFDAGAPASDDDQDSDVESNRIASLLMERDRERALLLTHGYFSGNDTAFTGLRRESDNMSIATAGSLYSVTNDSVDDAWYSRDPYIVGDHYEVRRMDITQERRSGLTRNDVLEGRRAGIAAPHGVRFASLGKRSTVHDRKRGRKDNDIDDDDDDNDDDDDDDEKSSTYAFSFAAISRAWLWMTSGKHTKQKRERFSSEEGDGDDDDEEVGLLRKDDPASPQSSRLQAIEILIRRDMRRRLLHRLLRVLLVILILCLITSYFLSTQESAWFINTLTFLGFMSRKDLSSTVSVELIYRYLSQCLAPVAVFCIALLSSTNKWHSPLHYILCHVVLRNPLFMLLSQLCVPFFISHVLVVSLVLRAGALSPVDIGTKDSGNVSMSRLEPGLSPYGYIWEGNVANLIWLYFLSLAGALSLSLILALFVQRPIRRYLKDSVMERFEVGRLWGDFL